MTISNIASMQEQKCNKIANGIFANHFCMESPENDKELIQALSEWVGASPSEVARRSGLAVSTLTRPLNQPVKFRLSTPTLAKLRDAFPEFPGWAGEVEADNDNRRDYLAIDVLPSYAGMGGGGSGEGEVQTGLVPRAFVENELRAKPTDLLLIEARGQSMEPDFLHGDQILIDKRDCNPIQPGSFALWDGDGYVIKLVERIPHKPGWYRIFSANGRYSSYEVDAEQITIMGRPVWFARRL